MNTATNPATAEFAPCAFCGCAMKISSNRDWHHLTGDHGQDCPFEADEDTMCVPANSDSLAWMIGAWNRRATQASAEPVNCTCGKCEWRDFYTGARVTHQICAACNFRVPAAAPSSAPSTEPACHCAACKPNKPFNQRMILCAICGNKRCPHATDHRNACTNSNEPGQVGSSYEPERAPSIDSAGEAKDAAPSFTGIIHEFMLPADQAHLDLCRRVHRFATMTASPDALATAYGILWHVNASMDAPAEVAPLSVTPERGAYEARKVLRGLLTHEQRGHGINAAREILAAMQPQGAGGGE